MAVRWLEHLHARETQKRRRSRDEEWFSHGESFNPTDLGAMLMSVAGFTLPSKEEIEQSLNTFWNRWMFFGGGHFGQNHQQSVSMYFMVFASCSFVLTLLLVVLLGMRYDFSRLAIILKEAVKSSRQNVSANSVKSIWFTLSSLVFARELMKAVKRRVFKRRLRRQRELRRRLNQQRQQQQQQQKNNTCGGMYNDQVFFFSRMLTR